VHKFNDLFRLLADTFYLFSRFLRVHRIHGSFHRGRERGHPERLAKVGVGGVGGVGETDRETVEKCVQERSFWDWVDGATRCVD
jgi:hypothetical protein